MSNKRKTNKYNIQQTDEYGQLEGMSTMNVASGTECTGMVTTPPLGSDDVDSLREIYDIPVEQSRVNTPSHDRNKQQ